MYSILRIGGCHCGVIECKDLALARTPREMAQELDNLFRGSRTKRPTIEKHQRRADWVRAHSRELAQWLGIERSSNWNVETLIVLDHRPASAHLAASPIPVLALDGLLNYVRN